MDPADIITSGMAVARYLTTQARDDSIEYIHHEIGYNYRLTNIQAAIALAQVERIAEIVSRKRWIGQSYTEQLSEISGLQLPVEKPWAKQVYWMYGVVLDDVVPFEAEEFALVVHGGAR